MSTLTAEELAQLEAWEAEVGAEPYSTLEDGQYLFEVTGGEVIRSEKAGVKARLTLKVLSEKNNGRIISDFLGWFEAPNTDAKNKAEYRKIQRGQTTRTIRVGFMQKNGHATRPIVDAYKMLPQGEDFDATKRAFDALVNAVQGLKVFGAVSTGKPSKNGKTYKRISYLAPDEVTDLTILPTRVSL